MLLSAASNGNSATRSGGASTRGATLRPAQLGRAGTTRIRARKLLRLAQIGNGDSAQWWNPGHLRGLRCTRLPWTRTAWLSHQNSFLLDGETERNVSLPFELGVSQPSISLPSTAQTQCATPAESVIEVQAARQGRAMYAPAGAHTRHSRFWNSSGRERALYNTKGRGHTLVLTWR
jgi:hypothetical protein